MEDVHAIFDRSPTAAPVRRCPSCGAEAATYRAECPACGKRYDRRAPWLSDRARWGLAIASVLLLAGLAAAILPDVFDARDRSRAEARRTQAAAEAAERRRLIREQRPIRGTVPAGVTRRTAMVGALEAAILADARARVATGELDGPLTSAHCDPLVRGEDPLRGAVGRFDCVAVKRPVIQDGRVVASLGHPYVATIHYGDRTWVLCKDNKVPGERGKPLAKVPLDAACVGAEGAARIGDGYAAPAR